MPDSIHDFARISSTVAQTGNVIDDFEDADIAEYSGDTGTAVTQTGTVFNRNVALSTESAGTFVYSTTGLPNYPAQDDIWETYAYTTEGFESTAFSDDFEDGDAAGWGSDTSATSTNPINGTYSATITNGGSGQETFTAGQYGVGEVLIKAETWSTSQTFVDYISSDGSSDSLVYIVVRSADGSIEVLTDAFYDTGIDQPVDTPYCWCIDSVDYNAQTLDVVIKDETGTEIYRQNYNFRNNVSDFAGVTVGAGSNGDQIWFDDVLVGDTGTSNAIHAFGVQDASNYYYVEADPGAGNLTLYKKSAGSDSQLGQTTGLTIPTATWLRIEVTWQTDGTMSIELFDTTDGSSIGTVSGTDTDYTSGGVGFGE